MEKVIPIIVTRAEWGARRPKKVEKLSPKAQSKFIVTWTGTETCKNKEECIKRVQEIQAAHMDDDDLPDIKYNFLVGSDDCVYEGRGWNVSTQVSTPGSNRHKKLDGNCLLVAFIGPKDSDPKGSMLMSVAGLGHVGMRDGHIDRNIQFEKLNESELHPYFEDPDPLDRASLIGSKQEARKQREAKKKEEARLKEEAKKEERRKKKTKSKEKRKAKKKS